jgi:hypothetical protein
MANKNSLRVAHKGLAYHEMTSDVYDGPRSISDRKWWKRYAAKRKRRTEDNEIVEQIGK